MGTVKHLDKYGAEPVQSPHFRILNLGGLLYEKATRLDSSHNLLTMPSVTEPTFPQTSKAFSCSIHSLSYMKVGEKLNWGVYTLKLLLIAATNFSGLAH